MVPPRRTFPLLAVLTLLGAAAGALGQGPPGAQDVVPVGECVTPEPGGTYLVRFGWEYRTAQPLPQQKTIPVGPQNTTTGGTRITGPDTVFDRPAGSAAGTLKHVVWPPFVWNPPVAGRSGRTNWWPAADTAVRANAGQQVRRTLDGRTASLTAGPGTQQCSHHLFVDKLWDGRTEPPAELDRQAYALTMTQIVARRRLASRSVNAGSAVCKYLEYRSVDPAFAPVGDDFSDRPSDRLNCVFRNNLPYSTDKGGFWVTEGGRYLVTETGTPGGWRASSGLGPFTARVGASTALRCTYYPAFGTPFAVPDADGREIPRFGRASAKWCVHIVQNAPVTGPGGGGGGENPPPSGGGENPPPVVEPPRPPENPGLEVRPPTPIPPGQGTRLEVAKSGPARVTAGSPATFAITVFNRGSRTALDVRLREELPYRPPPGSVRARPRPDVVSGSRFLWRLGAIPAGRSRTVLVTIAVPDGVTGGTIVNTAVSGAANAARALDRRSFRVVARGQVGVTG